MLVGLRLPTRSEGTGNRAVSNSKVEATTSTFIPDSGNHSRISARRPSKEVRETLTSSADFRFVGLKSRCRSEFLESGLQTQQPDPVTIVSYGLFFLTPPSAVCATLTFMPAAASVEVGSFRELAALCINADSTTGLQYRRLRTT